MLYVMLSFQILSCLVILSLSVQIRLRDYGVLDFDAGDARRHPPVETTWQQVVNTSFSFYNSFSNFRLFY